MTVKSYLYYAYDIVTNKEKTVDETVGIFICSSHFAAIILRQIKHNLPNGSYFLKSTIMSIIYLIVDSECLEDIDNLFQIFCTICLSKTKNRIFLENLKKLENYIAIKIENKNQQEIDLNMNIEVEDQNIENQNKPKYIESPFHKRFNSIYENIKQNIIFNNENEEPNELYAKDFVKIILDKYMSYLVLWSTILYKKYGYKNRPNNGTIENWFNIIKNNLGISKNQKVGRLIDSLEERITLISKAALCASDLKITKKNKNSNENPLTYFEHHLMPEDPNNVENWNKPTTKQRVPRYFGTQALEKYIKQNKSNFNERSEEYYTKMNTLECNIVVFKFKFNEYFECCMYNHCYSNLNDNCWLTTDLVYILINVVLCQNKNLDRSKIVVLDHYIIEKIFKSKNLYKIIKEKKQRELKLLKSAEQVILPICSNNHWVLAVLYFNDNKVITYDPFNPSKVLHNQKKYIQNFADELNKFNNKILTKLKFECNPALPCQNDGVNCGIFITYAVDNMFNGTYIENIHSDNSEENAKALSDYRASLKKMVIETSENLSEHCLVCYDTKKSKHEKQCTICKRFIHTKCMDKLKIVNGKCTLCE